MSENDRDLTTGPEKLSKGSGSIRLPTNTTRNQLVDRYVPSAPSQSAKPTDNNNSSRKP